MELLGGTSLFLMFFLEMLSTAFKLYLVNKLLIYALSRFFVGTENYSRVFLHNEHQLFLINLAAVFTMSIVQVGFIFIFINMLPENLSIILINGIHYLSYLIVFILSYKNVFKQLYSDVWGMLFITTLYTGVMLFADVLLSRLL